MQKKPIEKNQIIVGGTIETLDRKIITALQDAGYQVVFACNNKELLAGLTQSANTVAIIIDGDRDSFSLIPISYRKKHRTTFSTVLIFTSRFRITAVAHALQEGFDEFLAKPVGKEELLSVIRKAEKNKKSINQ